MSVTRKPSQAKPNLFEKYCLVIGVNYEMVVKRNCIKLSFYILVYTFLWLFRILIRSIKAFYIFC